MRFKNYLDWNIVRAVCVTQDNLSACKALLLGWPCDHSQRSGLLQTSKPPEKATDGCLNVWGLQRFQNPCDDDAREHGMHDFTCARMILLVHDFTCARM